MALGWQWLGRIGHQAAVDVLEQRRQHILAGADDQILFLCEHDPVVTLGRSAGEDHMVSDAEALSAAGVELTRASRGGDVTYHGPGQLMVYPVIRLARSAGVVAFLEAVAGALAETATALGVPGARWRREPAGLWVGDEKLAACGIHVHRRVTNHGFAFNVSTPAEAWRHIIPCGLSDAGVTSVAAQRAARGLGPPPAVEQVAELAAPLLTRALDRVREHALPSVNAAPPESH
jgi:lipoyl(octanoyl) transferase